MKKKLDLITVTLLILCIGLLIGYCFGYYRAKVNSFPKIVFTKTDINPKSPTIKLMEIKNGSLIGKIDGGKIRLIYDSDKILELQKENEFSIPINEIGLGSYYANREVPEGMMYAASSKGKYYYSVLDKRTFNLSPKNRLWFSTSEEAEKMGYIAK